MSSALGCERQEGGGRAVKKRKPRAAEETVSLQAQQLALSLQLKALKKTRSIGVDALLTFTSYWRTEAKDLSRQRAEVQQENEQLRAQLQAQKQVALRLVNLMKRRPSSRILQTLERYERAATKQAHKSHAEFDRVFADTDAMLAAADLLDQRSNLFVIRHEPSVQRGSCIEFRRCLSVPHDLAATSEAIWGFRPHQDLRRHFVYEHIKSGRGSLIGYTCRFQPKKQSSGQGPMQFRAEFLQRRYIMESRVVIVWKLQTQTAGESSSGRLQVRGLGFNVLESETAAAGPPTVIRAAGWFSPESVGVDLGQAQQDPRFQVLMEYLKHAFESFAAFTKQLGLAS